jgi:hypothetical protein
MKRNYFTSILVVIVSTAILVALFRFNQRQVTYEEYLVTNVTALFFLPILLIALVLREEPSNFGFVLGDAKRGYLLAGILFVLLIPLLIPASKMEEFQAYYPIQKWATRSLRDFGYFEISYGMYLFCWEFFFRGFLLFGLYKTIGWPSVFVQAIAFGIMHYGKPTPEMVASFGAGIVLGLLAIRAKSFLPGFVLHWMAAITFDLLIIASRNGVL